MSVLIFLSVESYRTRVWNPTTVLQRYFSNVPRFLHVLDLCDGIVSGSQALQLLQRTIYPLKDCDLDIFLPCDGLLQMGRWLKRQGYLYQPSGRKHIFFDVEAFRLACSFAFPGSRRIGNLSYPSTQSSPQFTTFHFIRTIKDEATAVTSTLRVQLVVVQGHPLRYLVDNFHSSKPSIIT